MSGTETLRFRKAEMPRSVGLNDTHREKLCFTQFSTRIS